MKILPLTTRQASIAPLVAAGYSTLEIADMVGLAQSTVKHHVANIYQKVGAFSRVEFGVLWNCELFQIGLRELGIIR